ncbi:MAG: glycine cleavage system protein GcvH [Candidatus Omnitrophica bacterium]|nr:glycine cleavage system protein GcvH [Candidatus Omnitrophota bacterium]
MTKLMFAKSHEWAKIEGDVATIGITDYAQGELGDIVFVELPKVGEKLSQFVRFGTIESTKTAGEVNSPLSGEVIEINNDLINNPQWLNEDAYGTGWMIKIKIEDRAQIDNLLDESAYKVFSR